MSRRRKIALLVVAGAHLALVLMGALEARFESTHWASRLASYYGGISGADSSYGFFAPFVGTQLRATFQIKDADGTKSTDYLETWVSHEADIRVRNIIGLFWRDPENLTFRRSLAASWAGKMFGKHPAAESVVVRLETYELPSMEEYRSGKEPSWSLYYEAKFVPQAHLKARGGAP